MTTRDDRDNTTTTQLAPERLTIISFIKAKSFRTQTALTDFDPIDSFKDVDLIMAIAFANGKIQRMTVRIDDDMPFDAL